MAIKISNLQQISDEYTLKKFYYKDLHLDFTKTKNFSTTLEYTTEGNDVEVDYDLTAIKNSLRNLFNTRRGQRFLFPRYGLDMNQYLFEAVTKRNGQLIGEAIVQGIAEFEPRVEVIECSVQGNPDLNQYNIDLMIRIPIINSSASLAAELNAKNQSFIFIETSRNR